MKKTFGLIILNLFIIICLFGCGGDSNGRNSVANTTITGKITKSSGENLENVSIYFYPDIIDSVTTNTNGIWTKTINTISKSIPLVICPIKNFWSFSPSFRSYSLDTNTISDANFTATEFTLDGQILCLVRPKSNLEDRGLYILNSDKSLTKINAPIEGIITMPSWSPDGEKIIFITDPPGTYSDTWGTISIMNKDGSSLEKYCYGTQPQLSSKGEIVFVDSGSYGQNGIFKIDTNGKKEKLIDDSFDARDPSWSSDGNWIVFTKKAIGKHQIFKMDANGENLISLTYHNRDHYCPKFSPDGSKIVFVADLSLIYVMDSNGTNQQKITNNEFFQNIGTINWSPDGQKIIFHASYSGKNGLFVINIDGTGLTKISDENYYFNYPSWH